MDKLDIIKIANAALEAEFEFKPKQLVPEARIQDDLGLDSLDTVDMIIVLEKAFKIEFPNKKALIRLNTLGDVYTSIEELHNPETENK